MKLYRKKPVVIEAVQLTKKTILETYSFVFDKPDLSNRIASDKWDEYEVIVKRYGMIIPTLEGDIKASIGDYIIRGIKGEYYPCKPDIFEMTYEPVN